MWSYEYEDDDYNVRDNVHAVVTSACGKGVFLQLENGQEAFAYVGKLMAGTEVLCTVLKKATEKWRVLVSIDSVLESVPVAA